MKKFVLILIIGLAFFACDDKDNDTHTHTYSTTWSTDATQHWHECTANDGAKTDIAPHTAGNWIIDPQATYDTDGSQHKECTVCEYITDTETIAKFKTEQPFTIGSVNFIFEYRRDDTVSWEKLESGVELYRTNIGNNPEGANATTINDLAAKADKPANVSYRIVVDYSNEGKAAGFTAIDGQTITVGSEYLANTTLTTAMLRNAFNAMVVSPWPIP